MGGVNMKIPFHRDAQKTTNNEILKVMHSESNSIELLSERLFAFLQQVPPHQPIVLVCVGTDRSTGDSLGPLVGTQLKKSMR